MSMSTLIVAKTTHLKLLQNEYAVALYWLLLCSTTFCIFLFDLNTPSGIAAGTSYALVVFGSLWLKGNQSTYIFFFTGTLLTIVGFYLSPGQTASIDIALTHCFLTLLVIACTAFMVLKIKKVSEFSTVKTDLYIDSLTNCKTDRAFVLELHAEIKRCKRYNHNLSLAVFDIDHFTQLIHSNKTNQHYKNSLIKRLSREISKSIRNSDQLYRISTDRFAVIFVETNIHEAKEVSNALREKISRANQSELEFHASFTVSVGIATLDIEDNRRKLYKRAEQALITAKENGRNQVSTLPETKRNGKPLVPAILLRSRIG